MPCKVNHVRPSIQRLTDSDARHLLAWGLIRTCHAQGGPSRVAVEAGCDEKTIRRARDEDSTLNLASAFNLLDVDAAVLDALLAAKGYMLRPMNVASIDVIPAAGATVHKIGVARSHDSPGGSVETDSELIAMEAEVEANLQAAEALKARVLLAKLRRAV